MKSPNELFETNIRLAAWALGRIIYYPLEPEDAYQAALTGLWLACRRYDGSTAFSTYALPRICGEILDQRYKARGAYRISGRRATPEMNYSLDQLQEWGADFAGKDVFSPAYHSLLDAKAILEALPMQWQAVASLLLDGRPINEIAKKLGVSISRVSHIKARIRDRLQRAA